MVVVAPAQSQASAAADRETARPDSGSFYADLPVLAGFQDLADLNAYAPVPDDWTVGLADVVASTEAIRAGRYKAVNTAGAAVISAVSNALGSLEFPYVFAGDGMFYAVPPKQAAAARRALSASVAWVGGELGLSLRGGEIDVASIRATGRDLRVARFAPSPDTSYAMFSGGGLAWAEAELKAGRLRPVSSNSSDRPDLRGLSCRFKPVVARHGLILSVIVSPRGNLHDAAFEQLVTKLLTLVDSSPDASSPIREQSIPLGWPPQGFMSEVRLQRREGQSLVSSLIAVGARTLGSALVMWAGRDLGSFSPARYRKELVANSDHRKFEDQLMMTIDCSPALADRIEALLAAQRAAGAADFGVHRQSSALITCVVPSPTRPDHIHFVDGAAGGYAIAAAALKDSRNDAAGDVDLASGPARDPVTSSALPAERSPP